MANAHIPVVPRIGRSILTSSNGFFQGNLHVKTSNPFLKHVNIQAAKPRKHTEEEKSNNFTVYAQSV